MTLFFIISIILPLALALILTPLVIRLALKVNAIDQPDKRKVHKRPIPRLGGLAVAGSFLISIGLLFVIIPEFFPAVIPFTFQPEASVLFSVAAGAVLLIILLGVRDDVKPLSPGFKFVIQIVAATFAWFAGFNITFVGDPFGTGIINLEQLSLPLTVLWIVGVTNAFNLIDGLDGLASGTAIIALTAIGMISIIHGQLEIVLFCLILGSATLGFLWYNSHPARIFLGDSGSLFLGFILALLSIHSYTKSSTSFAIFVPIFALGLPIIDTLLAMTRRFLSWFLPEKYSEADKLSFKKILHSIFQPDKSHIHHQLLQHGLSHKHTVLVLYMVSAFFGACAVIVALTTDADTMFLVLLAIVILILIGISKLKYKEIALLHNGIFLMLFSRYLINRKVMHKVIDSIFIVASCTAALLLTQSKPLGSTFLTAGSNPNLSMLLFVLLFQMGILYVSGLYRETSHQIGVADVFQIIKSVGLAVLSSTIAVHLIPQWHIDAVFSLLLLNFYILTTLILGFRGLFHLLVYLFRCSRIGLQNVLIHGTGEQEILILQRLLTMETKIYNPMGFLDENPEMEGKSINGLPVFGGHWKLEYLIRKHNIRQLFLSGNHMSPEIRERIESLSAAYGVKVKKIQIDFIEIPYNRSKLSSAAKDKMIYAK